MTYPCFDVEIDNHVTHFRLSRPEEYNTMNRAFWTECFTAKGEKRAPVFDALLPIKREL